MPFCLYEAFFRYHRVSPPCINQEIQQHHRDKLQCMYQGHESALLLEFSLESRYLSRKGCQMMCLRLRIKTTILLCKHDNNYKNVKNDGEAIATMAFSPPRGFLQ